MDMLTTIKKNKCALILSGGGAKTSFQVGVLDYLINYKGFDCKYLSGNGIGALHSSILTSSSISIPGFKPAFQTIKKLWNDIRKNNSIYMPVKVKLKQRLKQLICHTTTYNYLYDIQHLRKLIYKYIHPIKDDIFDSIYHLYIGILSLNDGKTYYATNHPKERIDKSYYKIQLEEYISAACCESLLMKPISIHINNKNQLCTSMKIKGNDPIDNIPSINDLETIIVINTNNISYDPYDIKHPKIPLRYHDLHGSQSLERSANNTYVISNILNKTKQSSVNIKDRHYKKVKVYYLAIYDDILNMNYNIDISNIEHFHSSLDYDKDKINQHMLYGFDVANKYFKNFSFI